MQSKPWYRFSWLLVLLLIACTQQAGAQQTAQPTIAPTPTAPPPPPELTFVLDWHPEIMFEAGLKRLVDSL